MEQLEGRIDDQILGVYDFKVIMHEYITPSSTIFIKMNYTCMLIRCDLANKIIVSNNISNVMLSGRIKKVIIHLSQE